MIPAPEIHTGDPLADLAEMALCPRPGDEKRATRLETMLHDAAGFAEERRLLALELGWSTWRLHERERDRLLTQARLAAVLRATVSR